MPLSSLLLLKFCSILSWFCQAAEVSSDIQVLPTKMRGLFSSFEGVIFESYPELVLQKDETDFACAFALGAYISQPKQQFLSLRSTAGQVEVHVDVAKMTSFLSEELVKIPSNFPEALGSCRKKLGEFVTRVLDLKKLETIVADQVKASERGFGFLKLHALILNCAKSQMAVISIDVAILKWVTLLATDEMIKPHIFKSENPIVDNLICKSLVSLANYPNLLNYIEISWEEFMFSLEKLKSNQELYSLYAGYVASLMLPLPEGFFKQKLYMFISDYIDKQAISYPNFGPHHVRDSSKIY